MLSVKLVIGELLREPNLDWNTMGNMQIHYVNFKLKNYFIRLMGFERYLKLREMTYTDDSIIPKTDKITLCGQNGEVCEKVVIDVINNTHTHYTILMRELDIDAKYWRRGELDNPQVIIK